MGTNIDVSNLGLDELDELAAKIEARKAELHEEQRQKVLDEVRDLVARSGMSVDEITAALSGKKGRATGKVAPKYRNPDNPSETWAGRGRKPKWVQAALEAGKSLESLAI